MRFPPSSHFYLLFWDCHFYICSQADLLTSSKSGSEQDRKRDRERRDGEGGGGGGEGELL